MDMRWLTPEPDGLDGCLTHAAALWRSSSPVNCQRTVTCQVDGCTADLYQEEKAYCLKKRICSYHMRAEVIVRPADSALFRFCFQCGKLEPLSQFDGSKRSCRARLERRKLPPRRSQTWTAGSTSHSSSSSTSVLQQQGATQQQQMLLLEIQQQQLQLEKQHQEMLLLQQQQQQLRMHGALQGTPALTLPINSAAAASPETLALVQQQQLLVQQKMQLQALRAAMEQNSQRLASHSLSSITGPITPAGLEAARTSYPGFQNLSPANISPSSSLNGMGGVGAMPAASASCAGFKSAFPAATQQGQLPAHANGFHVAAAVPTAAAAAAALAGSNGWPFMDRAAAAGGMDVWSAAAAAEEAQAKMARSKSAGHGLLNGADIPEDLEIVDEIDPLEGTDAFNSAVADAMNEELAAAFPDLDLMTKPEQAQNHQNPQHDDLMLQDQCFKRMQASTLRPQMLAGMPASAQHAAVGFMHPANSSAGGLGFGAPAAVMQAQQQAGMQPDIQQGGSGRHQQQLQQLMQSVQCLQNSVQELTLRMQGEAAGSGMPAGVPMPAASAGSFGGMGSM